MVGAGVMLGYLENFTDCGYDFRHKPLSENRTLGQPKRVNTSLYMTVPISLADWVFSGNASVYIW
jgi:hypothetical protein